MVNSLKQDFLLVRRLAFECTDLTPGPDSSSYADTLDYAVYGELPAKLILAQRSSLDLLDRVAVAVNEYLGTGLKAQRVDFRTYWTSSKRHDAWRPGVVEELAAGNRGLLALADLSFDLGDGGYLDGGYLSHHRELRNLGTHRYAVLHDYAIGPHSDSEAVEHFLTSDLDDSLMSTLRIARAAILYLIELIRIREDREHPHGTAPTLYVPDHDHIRGYD
jgi:hypothetical protein